MVNKSKIKGTQFESDVCRYLNEQLGDLFDVERRALQGVNDKGDVAGIKGWCIEAKAEKSIQLGGYMTELEAEIANAGANYGFAVVKRRQKSTADAYCVMPLSSMVDLIRFVTEHKPAVPFG